jgi:hypothetical protein
VMFARKACNRNSVAVSITQLALGVSIYTEDLQRWSRLSEDRQTEQSHNGTGIPTEVPVPRKVAVSIY